jgi:hypothetical protein
MVQIIHTSSSASRRAGTPGERDIMAAKELSPEAQAQLDGFRLSMNVLNRIAGSRELCPHMKVLLDDSQYPERAQWDTHLRFILTSPVDLLVAWAEAEESCRRSHR